MKNQELSAATIGLSLLLTTGAHASSTLVNPNFNEVDTASLLSNIYGGDFTQTALDFSNGSVTARRIDDSADQIWDGNFLASVVARFSGYSQQFGYTSANGFQPLIEAQGLGFEAGSTEAFATLDSAAFVRKGDSGTHSSVPTDNADGRDHLITYKIEPTSGAPVWVLFWEDLDLGPAVSRGRSSSDFNDLIVLVRSVEIGVDGAAVPLPPALGVGLVTLAMGGWFVRRRIA